MRYPEDEARLKWLRRLLDAYAVIDAGVGGSCDKAAGAGFFPACAKGCAACCVQPIPATPLEILGISWFAAARLAGRERQAIKRRLMAARKRSGDECPFLLDNACAVHPLRPAACRNFVVFGRACAFGEDVCAVRPQDVMRPSSAAMREAFRIMLPYYGITEAAAVKKALDEQLLYKKTVTLQSFDWSVVLREMSALDGKNR